jgi:hypothetical protein
MVLLNQRKREIKEDWNMLRNEDFVSENDSDRRHNERYDLSFEVLLPDQDGKTINVSASGVYFEVTTNDMEAFSPGATISLQINTVTNTTESRERKLKLGGRGTVIRNCIIENPDHDNRLGVALEFTDKLNIVLDND